MWKLLASDTGPLSIALLQTLLYDNERVLPASLFLERLASGYAEGAEESLSRDEARALASRWVADGLCCSGGPQNAAQVRSDSPCGALVRRRFPNGKL